jgi:hypothetical protein
VGVIPGGVRRAGDSVGGSLDDMGSAVLLVGEALTVACAVESVCVLISEDTPVNEALARMEEEGQEVAVVLASRGGVMGVVSREVLVRCVGQAAAGMLAGEGGGGGGDGGPAAAVPAAAKETEKASASTDG